MGNKESAEVKKNENIKLQSPDKLKKQQIIKTDDNVNGEKGPLIQNQIQPPTQRQEQLQKIINSGLQNAQEKPLTQIEKIDQDQKQILLEQKAINEILQQEEEEKERNKENIDNKEDVKQEEEEEEVQPSGLLGMFGSRLKKSKDNFLKMFKKQKKPKNEQDQQEIQQTQEPGQQKPKILIVIQDEQKAQQQTQQSVQEGKADNAEKKQKIKKKDAKKDDKDDDKNFIVREFNGNFLNDNFQLKDILSDNTQRYFKERTCRPNPYNFTFRDELLKKEFTKLSHFVLETCILNTSSKEIWQSHRISEVKRKFFIKIFKGQNDVIQEKYQKKNELVNLLKNISSEKIVKSEELLLAEHDIFCEQQYSLLIEVKSSTLVTLEDILLVRRSSQAYFKEEEVIYLFKHLVEIFYQAELNHIYHSHLTCDDIVIFFKQKKISHQDYIDPVTFNPNNFDLEGCDIEYKVKDMLYNQYNWEKKIMILSNKKLSQAQETFYYPKHLIADFLDGDNEVHIENIHKVDVYSLGIVILSIMMLESPSHNYDDEEVTALLKKLRVMYPKIIAGGLSAMLQSKDETRPSFELILKRLELHDAKKPLTRKYYEIANSTKIRIAQQKEKEQLKEKKQAVLSKRNKKGGQHDDSFEEEFSSVNTELNKANTYLMFKNYEMAEKVLKDALSNHALFIDNYFSAEDFLDINFHVAVALLRDHKFKESYKLLKTLQIDLRKASCEKSHCALKIHYYLVLISFLMGQVSTTLSNLETLSKLIIDIDILGTLDDYAWHSFNVLCGMIFADFDFREESCNAFAHSLQQNLQLNNEQESLIYYYLAEQRFAMGDYDISQQYFEKSLELHDDTPWELMCHGYIIEMCDILCRPNVLVTHLETCISMIKFMIINDKNINILVNWCNMFGKFISIDNNFKAIGDHIVIAIEKNVNSMSFTMNYICYVIAQVYFYIDNTYQSDKYFTKAIANGEAGLTIFTCLSQEWQAFLAFSCENNVQKALPKYQIALDSYEAFLRYNQNYYKFILLRQMYITKFLNKKQDLFKKIKQLVDLEDKYKSDKKLEAEFKSFQSFIFYQMDDLIKARQIVQSNNVVDPEDDEIIRAKNQELKEKQKKQQLLQQKQQQKNDQQKQQQQQQQQQIEQQQVKNNRGQSILQVNNASQINFNQQQIVNNNLNNSKSSNQQNQQSQQLQQNSLNISGNKDHSKQKIPNNLTNNSIKGGMQPLIQVNSEEIPQIQGNSGLKQISQQISPRHDYQATPNLDPQPSHNKPELAQVPLGDISGIKEESSKEEDEEEEGFIDIIKSLYPEASLMVVRYYMITITDCLCLGLYHEAIHYCKQCNKQIQRYFCEDDDYSDFYVLYGYIELINNHYSEAIEILDNAERELSEEMELNKNDLKIIKRLASVSDITGRVHSFLGNQFKALQQLEKTIQFNNIVTAGKETLDQGYRYAAISNAYFQLGFFNSAIESIKTAMHIIRKTKKVHNKDRLFCQLKIFEIQLTTYNIMNYESRYKKFIETVKNDIEIVVMTEHPDVYSVYNKVVGKYLIANEAYPKAEEHFQRAYKLLLNIYGPYDVPALEARILQADSLLQQDNQMKAHEILQDLQLFLQNKKVVNIGISFEIERLIGRDCFMDSRYIEAQIHFENAFQICRQVSGNKKHPRMGEIFLYLASCYFACACGMENGIASDINQSQIQQTQQMSGSPQHHQTNNKKPQTSLELLIKSKQLYQKSQEIYINYYNGMHRDCALLFLEIGKVFFLIDIYYKYMQYVHMIQGLVLIQRQFLIVRINENDPRLIEIFKNYHDSIQQQKEAQIMANAQIAGGGQYTINQNDKFSSPSNKMIIKMSQANQQNQIDAVINNSKSSNNSHSFTQNIQFQYQQAQQQQAGIMTPASYQRNQKNLYGTPRNFIGNQGDTTSRSSSPYIILVQKIKDYLEVEFLKEYADILKKQQIDKHLDIKQIPKEAITYQYLMRDPSLLYFQHAKQMHTLYYRVQNYIIDQIEECIQYFQELYLVQVPESITVYPEYEESEDEQDQILHSKESDKEEVEQKEQEVNNFKAEQVAEGLSSISQFMKKQESMNKEEVAEESDKQDIFDQRMHFKKLPFKSKQ